VKTTVSDTLKDRSNIASYVETSFVQGYKELFKEVKQKLDHSLMELIDFKVKLKDTQDELEYTLSWLEERSDEAFMYKE